MSYQDTSSGDRIRQLFDRLAPGYDLWNSLFSFGRDGAWRRRAADLSGLKPGERAVDLCTGTGKLADLLSKRVGADGYVLGVDFAGAMVQRARQRFAGIDFREADVTALPLPESSFDAATIAFGLRNVQDRAGAIREAARVLRPGGRFVILEFTPSGTPGLPLPYRFYLERLMPLFGGSAYRYLAESIKAFPSPIELEASLGGCGFREVFTETMTFKIVTFQVGTR